MKFVSIRQKLITRVSLIFILSFLGVLTIVALLNANTSRDNQRESEASIRSGLIAKGRTLVNNNSQALRGLVEDNAYSAVKDLVASTVRDDEDVIYGIFMDVDKVPWVNATPANDEGSVKPGEELSDDMTTWAAGVKDVDYKTTQFAKSEVYEFAAPVKSKDEILGFIRYGITTDALKKSLQTAAESARAALIRTMLILIAVGIGAVGIGVFSTRQIARHITKPLQGLTTSAETIAAGDYNAEVSVNTNDEIGVLAQNFDSMRVTIKKKMADLARLNSTGEVLASLLDQNRALEEVLKTMNEQIGVGQGSVYLMNEHEKLEVKAYYPPKIIDAGSKPAIFSMGEGILGHCASTKQIIFVKDTSNDDSFVSNKDGAAAKSLLCIPLVDKDVLIGVMNFSGEVGKVNFEDSDYEFASSVARLLVITIKNIRMRELIEEQNRTLEQKVEARTAELQQKTNDVANMLANMHQGLFTIMDGGTIHHEYAAYLGTIMDTNRIANRNFMDLLFPQSDLGSDAINQVETAVSSLLGSDEMMFDFNSHLLVKEFTKEMPDGKKKILELDWDPIVYRGEIEKIMVTVRDVTELKALQKAAEAQKQELEIIGHILAVDATKFDEFLSTSYGFIKQCRELIEATPEKDLAVVGTLFRNMHTVKGNARTYGFLYVTNSVHEVEHGYDELRKDPEKEWNPAQMLADLDRAENDIQRYEHVAREKLGRIAGFDSEGVSIDRERVKRVLDNIVQLDVTHLPAQVQACLKETYSALIAVEAQPVSEVLGDVFKSVASLAQELHKPNPRLDVDDGDVLVRHSAQSMLNNIFMHVLRNAVDHGIEAPEQRVASGKPERGEINLSVTEEGGKAVLTVRDDGRGLAIGRIYQKAIDCGIYDANSARPAAADIANQIFASGFSTADAVTEISGRGVGLDAVKKFLEQEGGSIEICLDDGDETADFRKFTTKITLPAQFYIRSLEPMAA